MVTIHAVVVPKWGITMEEGTVTAWLAEEGAPVGEGEELLDIETTKAANAIESRHTGILRRRVAQLGETLPVGALLAVIADASVSEADIDAFVAERRAKAVSGETQGPAIAPERLSLPDQRSLRYLKLGEAGAMPAVLLHGWGGDLDDWAFNQSTLSEGRAVYALDLPGHGGSSKDVGDGSAAAMAGAVRAALSTLGLERIHLCGHSFGGGVALELALGEPDRIASLSLIAPTGLGREIDSKTLEGFGRADRRRELTPFIEVMYGNASLVTRAGVEETLKRLRIDGVREAMRRIHETNFPDHEQRNTYLERRSELTMPVLVIWGKSDRIIPVAHAGALPGARSVLLEGVGHMPQAEAAGTVNAELARHMRASD